MPPSPGSDFRTIDSVEAEDLVRDGAVRVLDVRTPREYETLGHVPDAILLPVDLIACGAATLPRDGKPLLVYCEHGIRSRSAARFLAQAGIEGVLNLGGGLSRWRGPRRFAPGNPYGDSGPSSWVVANADLVPRGGRVLDLACGTGRHSLLLATAGFSVRAVDRDPEKIHLLASIAGRLQIPLRAEVLDLEDERADLGEEAFDLVVGIHYLHRPLFPSLDRTLRKDGILLYETFTREQALRGKPTNPAFLLEPGELRRLCAHLEILREREGEFEGRMVSGIVARRN